MPGDLIPACDAQTRKPHPHEGAGHRTSMPGSITVCDSPDGLADISQPDIELALWPRSLPLCLRNWLESLDASQLPELRVLVRPDELRQAVNPQLDEHAMPAGDMRDLLVGDIHDLVTAFARITGSDLVDVRLERVSDDACWKFHRDYVAARLLTTYRGPGTEWVQPEQAEQALKDQREYNGPIAHFRNNDVAIFKGSCAGDGSGIVHRSPPIAGTGQTRLLLCLNERSAASPAPWPQEREPNHVRHGMPSPVPFAR